MTPSAPLGEGLTEQWLNEQWLNVGCTQERLLDPAVAGAPRLQPAASLPQKSLQDSVAAVFQGLWEITTYIWYQVSPLTTLFQHQRMWVFAGVCCDQLATQSLPNVLPAMELLLSVWPVDVPDAILLLEIRPSHQSTTRYQAAEFQILCIPYL